MNRRGNSPFVKNLLGLIESKWISESQGDITISLEDVSNVSSLDGKQVLRGIRKSNINTLVFGQLNIYSLRNKFDMLSEMIKGFVDLSMISETKLADSFPGGQFFIVDYHTPFRFDRIGNGHGILLYIREDIQLKSSTVIFQHLKVFMLKLVFIRKSGC